MEGTYAAHAWPAQVDAGESIAADGTLLVGLAVTVAHDDGVDTFHYTLPREDAWALCLRLCGLSAPDDLRDGPAEVDG